MPELSGSLANFEITTLVRFLCGLDKSGDLLLSRANWISQLSVDRGRLIAASANAELGGSALEFIAAVMSTGDFEFSEGPPTLEPNLHLDDDPLVVLERLTADASHRWIHHLFAPTAVPRIIESRASDEGQVTLPRRAIYLLRDLDGSFNVRDLASRYGLIDTLKTLDRLHELDLIEFASGPSEPPSGVQPPGSTVRRDSGRVLPASRGGPVPADGRQMAVNASPGPLERARAWRQWLPGGRARSVATELGQAVLITGLFIFGIRSMVQNFRVEGVSMLPTFEGGQALVINRAAYLHVEQSPLARIVPTTQQGAVSYVFGGPQRGDVVVFRAPPQPDADYIKRIIGLPGDTVSIRHGQVFINGEPLAPSYNEIPASYDFPPGGESVRVPDAEYFVLGDNRPESFDSHLGWFVPADSLIGRAWLRYWPPSEVGVVPSAPVALAAHSAK
jgi:signal peptidase I